MLTNIKITVTRLLMCSLNAVETCSGNFQTLLESGNERCNAALNLIMFPGACDIRCFRTKILYTVSPKNYFFRGKFLFVRRKCHVLIRFFFISSHYIGLIFTKSISNVVSGTKRFAPKITVKF